MYKFNGARYLTRGIQAEIPLALQSILWFMVDDNIKKGLPMDYLQIFKLMPYHKDGTVYQKIIHSQEIPQREKTAIINVIDKPISEKIYIIDDLQNITMLLADEY